MCGGLAVGRGYAIGCRTVGDGGFLCNWLHKRVEGGAFWVGSEAFWGVRKDVGPCAQGVEGGARVFESGVRGYLACGVGL